MTDVLIAGAGPCGLVAALTLKRQGVPFVIIERAQRSKLCANVGSGYDLAPTAIDILSNRLRLEKTKQIYADFSGLRVQDTNGKEIRVLNVAEMTKNVKFLKNKKHRGVSEPKFGTINRADLQNMLLDELFPTPESEEGVLLCGAGVQSYTTKKNKNGPVVVTISLSDGTTLDGRVLFACDGIHSAIRRQMHQQRKDDLHFCNITCYWGKTEIEPGSQLQKDVRSATKDGKFGIMTAGSGKHPGNFIAMECNNQLIWALLFKADVPPGKQSGDLTRRGGKVLDEARKEKLLNLVNGRGDLVRVCLEGTRANDITEAGLFDRLDNTLPFTDEECVVLMGDSAHPQSPYMGQGCNMAVVDAYVVATRLAKDSSVTGALKDYDTEKRKSSVRKVVEQARMVGNLNVSTNGLTCCFMKMMIKHLPASWLFADLMNGDQSNHEFVKALDEDFPRVSRQ